MKRKRQDPELRKKQILDAAVQISIKSGYRNLKRATVAKKAKVSVALVTRYFSMYKLRSEVLKQAINQETIEIIAQGMAYKDKLTKNLSTAPVFEKVIAFLKA